MARIVYSGLIDSIRGSIGGTTFQRNKYGHTVKNKPNMVKPRSPWQIQRQQSFRHVVKTWQDLTNAQRADWNNWANTFPQYSKFNVNAQLSGYAVFCQYHMLTNLWSDGVATNPSYDVPAEDILLQGIFINDGVLTWQVQSETDDQDWNLVMFLSMQLAPSQNYVTTRTRYVGHTTNYDNTVDITSAYLAHFGRLPDENSDVALDFILVGLEFPKVQQRIHSFIQVQ